MRKLHKKVPQVYLSSVLAYLVTPAFPEALLRIVASRERHKQTDSESARGETKKKNLTKPHMFRRIST